MSFSHRRFLFAITGGVETFHIDAHMLHFISFCCEISQIPLHPNSHTSNHPHCFALQCRLGFDFVPQFNADVSNYVAIHLLPSPWRISCRDPHLPKSCDMENKSKPSPSLLRVLIQLSSLLNRQGTLLQRFSFRWRKSTCSRSREKRMPITRLFPTRDAMVLGKS